MHLLDDPHGGPYWPTWPCFSILAASKVGKTGGRQIDGSLSVSSHLKQARLLMNSQVKCALTG